MKLLVVLLLVAAILMIEAKPTFYARSVVQPQSYVYNYVIQSIDVKTGAAMDVITTYLINGEPLAYIPNIADVSTDGIMCYSEGDGKITCVNLNTKSLLPVLFTEQPPASGIMDIIFDPKKNRFLYVGSNGITATLTSYQPGSESFPELWTELGTIQNQYYDSTGTLDAENQIMYWISYFSSDGDYFELYLSSASVDTPYQPSFLVKLDVTLNIVVQTLVYDPKQKKLLFFAGDVNFDNTATLTIYTVDTNSGNCTALKTDLTYSNDIQAFNYDYNTRLIYAVAIGSTSNNYQLFTIDAATGATINVASTNLKDTYLDLVIVNN